MKSNIITAFNYAKTAKFIAVIVLAGAFASCEKDTLEQKEEATFILTSPQYPTLRIGEDDEDLVVIGTVIDGEQSNIQNAAVELVDPATNIAVDLGTTGAIGEFTVGGSTDDYFVRVTPIGSTSVRTSQFELTSDTTMMIVI